jgi:hypothetical protein
LAVLPLIWWSDFEVYSFEIWVFLGDHRGETKLEGFEAMAVSSFSLMDNSLGIVSGNNSVAERTIFIVGIDYQSISPPFFFIISQKSYPQPPYCKKIADVIQYDYYVKYSAG